MAKQTAGLARLMGHGLHIFGIRRNSQRIFSNTNAATHLIGNTEFAFPKIRINSFILMKRKHAHGDAAYLEMSLGYEFLLGSVDFNYFTFFGFTVEMSDGT